MVNPGLLLRQLCALSVSQPALTKTRNVQISKVACNPQLAPRSPIEPPRKLVTPYNGPTYGNPYHPAEVNRRADRGGGKYRCPRFHSNLHSQNVIICDKKPRYCGGPMPSATIDSNRVEFFRNARFTRPVGPLRCLAIMSSAFPCRSGSSCL